MPNHDNSVVLGLGIAFPVIATASVVFRFETRRIKRLKLEADDWTVLAALVNICVSCNEFAMPLADEDRSSTLLLQLLSLSVRLDTAALRNKDVDEASSY